MYQFRNQHIKHAGSISCLRSRKLPTISGQSSKKCWCFLGFVGVASPGRSEGKANTRRQRPDGWHDRGALPGTARWRHRGAASWWSWTERERLLTAVCRRPTVIDSSHGTGGDGERRCRRAWARLGVVAGLWEGHDQGSSPILCRTASDHRDSDLGTQTDVIDRPDWWSWSLPWLVNSLIHLQRREAGEGDERERCKMTHRASPDGKRLQEEGGAVGGALLLSSWAPERSWAAA